jgi:hypothetical protein
LSHSAVVENIFTTVLWLKSTKIQFSTTALWLKKFKSQRYGWIFFSTTALWLKIVLTTGAISGAPPIG